MENGDADGYHLSFLAAAGAATEDDYGDRAFADGQWKCVRPATTCFLGRCTSSSWYYGKYARVVANVECRQLPAQLPAARDQLQVYSYAFWFGFSNGEWRM